eukprot:1854323-Rhodomonas_salina.2
MVTWLEAFGLPPFLEAILPQVPAYAYQPMLVHAMSGIRLRADAMSSTDLGAISLRACYATLGTDVAYGASSSAWYKANGQSWLEG